MRRKQKSPAARRPKRVKGLNNKPTENSEPPFGAASLARVETKTVKSLWNIIEDELHLLRVWKPKRLNTKTKASDYGCISRACGNFLQKSNRKRQLKQFNLDYLFSLFSNAEVIVRPKIYEP